MQFFHKKPFRSLFVPILERAVRVDASKVVFVVKNKVPFSGNVRALAEALLAQGDRQLVVYKDGPLDVDCLAWRARGVRVYEGFSWQALRDVHSAGTVVLGHSGRDAFLAQRKPGRRVINLWHGVAIKRIEHLMPAEKFWSYKTWRRRYLMRVNSRVYDAMVASSATDRLTNALAFGLDLDKVHATGLPRFDYLAPDYVFPANLQVDINNLTALLAGRRMVLYAPTFREGGASALSTLTPQVLASLKTFLQTHNLVLGIGPHPYDQKALAQVCDGKWIVDLRPDLYAEPAIVLRAASALVVDYSSIWVDYLLLKRPMIGLMPDFESYATQERGFIFDLNEVFPGPIFREWQAVMDAMAGLQVKDFSLLNDYENKYIAAENIFLPNAHLKYQSTKTCLKMFFDID